jgi:hypothetical protein
VAIDVSGDELRIEQQGHEATIKRTGIEVTLLWLFIDN